MSSQLHFVLNGRELSLREVSPNTTLLEFLRARGLTGAKEGCAEGDCGACSMVMIERNAAGRPAYRAVNSCLLPVCLLAGREVMSVEAIGHVTEMHPVQQQMIAHFGSQCGYCTPGFICSMFEGYYRDDLRTGGDLDDQLCGNLCRCTGYRPIRDAARHAFAARASRGKDHFDQRLKAAAINLAAAEYEFDGNKFFRPAALAELFSLRAEHPEARLVAGATELGLDITKRYQRFPTLISVEAVAELKCVEPTESEWRIGAAVTLTDIADRLAGEFPALGDMLRVFGSRQIRNRATMGGNLVTASPIGDCAPVLLALDAGVRLASPAGERTLPLDQFFIGYRRTALRPDEVLKSIVIPRHPARSDPPRQTAWFKVSKRREMDISTVAACFTVERDARNLIRLARLAYGGVATMPVRASKTEAALLGKSWTEETIREVLPILRAEFAPLSDVRGSAEYRRGLVTGLFQKFFCEASCADLHTAGSPLHAGNLADEPVPGPPHESAHNHVTGAAVFVDDQPAGKRFLETWPVGSPHAHAKILKRDATAARAMPGIQAVLLAEDIPGDNDVGVVVKDEILLADKEALFHGHLVALVVGDSQEACRAAADRVVIEYEALPPILTLRDGLAAGSVHNEPSFIRRGDVQAALAAAPMQLDGQFELGGQEHFYLETQAAWAERGENGTMFVSSATQHPSEVQSAVAHVLNLSANKVVVQCPRLGGGFGGKETQAATPAALAALAAHHTGQPVRVRWNRDQDMTLTGHRHPFLAKFKVGFDADGVLRAAQIHLWSNGGWSLDLSQAVTDRALFHLDNCYFIPAVEFRGQVVKTNLASNTAFRGFGGPQGMLVIEEILDRVARRLNLPPEVVRERNLYHGKGETNTTHYGQELEDHRIQTLWHELKRTAEIQKRRVELAQWNAAHPHTKRGLAITPVKFGISFTVTHLNQAGALVLIYQDGTVQVNHGGTEMGQGIHTNIAMIAAKELGVKLEHIRVMPTGTDKVPNTSATAASSGTDLNGAAVTNACALLRERLATVAAAMVRLNLKPAPGPGDPAAAASDMIFADGFVIHRNRPAETLPFAAVAKAAYLQRVSLSATGYYATPGIHWGRAAGRGRPFHYFAQGAAVAEVEVDGFTGMHRVLRVDVLHDAGDSINEGVNRGQIEGGFVQGMGWLTMEELQWDEAGRLLTHSPDTYKIPSFGDTPQRFQVSLLKNATQRNVIHGSKAVGEPPLMLAISVREAIRDAVSAFGAGKGEVPLAVPATCEAIWSAIQQQREPAETDPFLVHPNNGHPSMMA